MPLLSLPLGPASRLLTPPGARAEAPADASRGIRRVLLVQGGYYVATGVMPFVSRTAFETVTGPKEEWWLVQTVGGLITAIGAGLLCAGRARHPGTASVVTAGGSAAVLAGIDVVYSIKRHIAPVYLIDAGAELGFAAALWLNSRRRGRTA